MKQRECVPMARLTREGGRRETDMPASERRGAAYELRGVIGARLFIHIRSDFFSEPFLIHREGSPLLKYSANILLYPLLACKKAL